MAYAYLLRCADGTFYAGWTVDIDNRLAAHNAGTASRYTRARLPVELAYFERFDNQSAARKRECEFKRLNRRQKEELIKKGSQP